jgi:hypothetical protein
MARVRIMTSVATTDATYKRGDQVDLDTATAESWVDAGMAVPVGGDDQNVAETTARRTGRTGARKPKGG